jgi:DNA-binding winged helix-turn-helix (wHTH) protein/serine/threonine protein kinase/tetratricopeptide (TPR) repeat protein
MPSASPSTDQPLYRYRFGAADFDESRFELSVGGLVVEVQQKPLQVLAALLHRPGEVVSREELLQTVWADRVTVEQVLANAVAKLRRALGETDGARIVTVPRSGYRFDGPVERLAVGSRVVSKLELKAGGPVPGRDSFVLVSALATSMGAEVWLARHRKTDDLRVYKFARDGAHLSTLKREATLYRLLREMLGERNDLARILDWNFEAPPFYLECAYGGPNLIRWAHDFGQLQSLSLESRIRLFLQIADAVAAAHQVGVLHKDLKPANILITSLSEGRFQARVADFGSGRLLEPERLEGLGITQLGLTVTQGIDKDSGSGTPLYLAPELLAGTAPTVQSDLFALGLMLYQLINGDLRKPMAPGWEHSIADELLVEDITAATHGDPARRLNSVTELTQRLRSLDSRRQERVAEKAANDHALATQQALERSRIRRPWILTALGLMIIGTLVSYSLYRQERASRLQAEHQATRAATINRFLSEDLLGAADPSGPGTYNPTIREVLDRTAALLDTRFAADPHTKASIELALGNAYYGLSDYAAAEKYRRDAVGLLTASQGADDTATVEADYDLAMALGQTTRLDEAGALLTDTDRRAGARLSQETPLAFKAHWARANYYRLRMSAPQALAEYNAAERVRAAINPDDERALARLRSGQSWCYVRIGQAQKADEVLQDVLAAKYTPTRLGAILWASLRINDATALNTLKRYTDAQKALQAALQELRQTTGTDNVFVAHAENELGEVYSRAGQWPEAADCYREAYRIYALRLGEEARNTLITRVNLGIVEYKTGHSAVAAQTLEPLRARFSTQSGTDGPLAQATAFYLAGAERDLGNYTEAATLAANLDATQLSGAEPRNDWPAQLDTLRRSILQGLHARR